MKSAVFFALLFEVTVGLFNLTPALAGEGLFGRPYTVETVPAGHYELEQLIRSRSGRAYGHYSAFDFKSEFEYGVTDQFQAAFYLNTGYIDAKNSPDDDDPSVPPGFSRNRFFVQGVSTEFIYRITSPVTDPLGIAFYFEPGYQWHDFHNGLAYDHMFETEYRILLQKNLMEDQLILVYNMVAEIEFIRFEGQDTWRGELDWNHELGGTYRVASNWYAGLEARNHNELGNFKTHEHSVIWAGPTAHYAGEKFWATLGILKQVWGGPNGTAPNGTFIGNNLFLRSHENWEITFKIAVPF